MAKCHIIKSNYFNKKETEFAAAWLRRVAGAPEAMGGAGGGPGPSGRARLAPDPWAELSLYLAQAQCVSVMGKLRRVPVQLLGNPVSHSLLLTINTHLGLFRWNYIVI